jgi:hypothetical protein
MNDPIATVKYMGTLDGLTHKNPITGNVHKFAGKNVPAKLYDSRDVDYYKTKNHFKVTLIEKKEEPAPISKEDTKEDTKKSAQTQTFQYSPKDQSEQNKKLNEG